MVRSALFILLIVSACTAVSFTTVIGDTSQFGAQIIIDNNDSTGTKWFDSLCDKYEYLSYIQKPIFSNYDFRIKIVKKAKVSGNLFVSADEKYWVSKDTLSCDSLAFSKEIAVDTLKGDSVVYEWSYLRPTISKAVTSYQYDLNFLNHLKIKIQSGIIKDSVIISRQRVIFNNVKYGINDRRKNNSPTFLLSDKQTQLFDLRGMKIKELRNQSIAVVYDKKLSKTRLLFVR